MSVPSSTTHDGGIEITTECSHADLVDAVSRLAQQVDILSDQVETLEEENQELRAELEATREDLEATRDHGSTLARDIAETRGRVSDLEDANADASSAETTEGSQLHETIETPLETIVAWSEEVADDELYANQRRARFVASDVRDYARKVPAGYAIKSSDIGRVLAARDDGSTHPETVNRVIQFLDTMGKAGVEVVKRRGERRVVFAEELVERLDEASSLRITSCVTTLSVEV